ncbi:hypothetical protein FACS189485_03460 [Spirochaetia bacterium]|nr:hypothetical protein FACS189485_03460 [Spirochaetia bacterium]
MKDDVAKVMAAPPMTDTIKNGSETRISNNAHYYFANREKYIEIIAVWSWKKTERHIDIIRQQFTWILQKRMKKRLRCSRNGRTRFCAE